MNARILFERCPLCDNESLRAYTTGDCSRHTLYQDSLPAVMQWKQCIACGHIFTEGYFTEEACNLIFNKTHEYQKVGYDIERQRYVSARMVEKVLPHIDHGMWLDVGFGNGSLLFTAQEYGFTPVGIDLREENVAALKMLRYQHGGRSGAYAVSKRRPRSRI
jgi:protein O-GlcNAc transferase